jgi:hypothetical protein
MDDSRHRTLKALLLTFGRGATQAFQKSEEAFDEFMEKSLPEEDFGGHSPTLP